MERKCRYGIEGIGACSDKGAIYMSWLMKRIEIGYLVWTNLFYGVKSYIYLTWELSLHRFSE